MDIKDTTNNNIDTSNFFNNLFSFKTLISILIMIVSVIIATIASNKLNNTNINNNRKIVIATLSNIVYYVIILIGFLISLLNAGFQIGSIIVVLSSLGIALALCIQNILKQFVAGLTITFNNMYNINDDIITNQTEGTVTKFSLLNTTLTDTENITTIIPNDKIVESNLTNITYQQNIKVKVYFTIKNEPNFDVIKFIELIKKTILLSKYVVNKNIEVHIDNISHMMGTKIVVKAMIKSSELPKAKYDIQLLLLRTLNNTKLLYSKINILVIDKELEYNHK
jgi:small-conductance mechanosensitive channel